MTTWPQPRAARVLGHLPRWGVEPLALLEEGAALARQAGTDFFRLQLGGPAVVGFSPAWNRRLLGDLDTFRSAGSFSRLVPHLAGGIILTDAPQHALRRRELNPSFGKAAIAALTRRMHDACPEFVSARVPEADALAWADRAALRMLNAAYFSSEFDEDLLRQFLAPLRRDFPAPMLPRPVVGRRVEAELRRLAAHGERSDLLGALRGQAGGLTEARISLAAAHDTSTHALAYCLWFVARFPQWHAPQHHPALLKEVLRLYPPAWMGSRRLARDTDWQGQKLPRGTLALYSPYLSGRDPALWAEASAFKPQRWTSPPPAWAYLPFGGGERTCLGLHLAQALILTALSKLPPLQVRWGRPEPHPSLTLGPRGPLVLGVAH